MAKTTPTNFVNVNFYGHHRSELSGKLAGTYRPTMTDLNRFRLNVVGSMDLSKFKNVTVFNYNAALGKTTPLVCYDIAQTVFDAVGDPYATYLVTGYSSGGPSAIYFAQAIDLKPVTQIGYVGLSDAAFVPNESQFLMNMPGVYGTYSKNYYQTKADPSEIHGPVLNYTSFDLTSQIPGNLSAEDAHFKACQIGNVKMCEDVVWCLKNL